MNERVNLWIKPHDELIKIKYHFSGAHFDDKFITFVVASCILVPDPILCKALFWEISCWNHICHYQTVSTPYNLTCWQLTTLHHMEFLSWMAIFHLLVNENDFSAPFERRTLSKSHDDILHASFHWHHKCHYEKLELVIVMVSWSGNADTGRKTISGLNHIMKHQLQIMSLIRLFSICQCCTICHHDTYSKEKIWLLP